jgi:class 3 adenylate cyclase/tetratricopeptide (TPR) repeat protein
LRVLAQLTASEWPAHRMPSPAWHQVVRAEKGGQHWPVSGAPRRLRLVRTCSNCGHVNPDEAAFCMACGASLAPTPAPREQRKTVTIVFCDVMGSTSLGERLDPEALRRVMSRFFDEMKTSIERHGGTVEKFIGDAVMAVFGIPLVHEDDALRAVRAAVDMRVALELLNKELEREHGVTLATRIGVNTGEVVAGASEQTLVTGDTVNIAARLEQAAAPGEVLIGERTHRLVRDAVVVDPVEPLELKGKVETVPALRLVSVAGTAAGRARRLDSPMIGRERPLALLLQLFEGAAADRACHLFTVLGSAGVGKSRLVEEFVSRLEDRAALLRGRCLPYGDGITYFPVIEIVKEAAGLADFDAPDVVEAKVCAALEDDEQQGIVCSRLSQLLGVQETASPEETHWAIRRFLEAQAREGPLVVVFDDIHWGEPALLDLIEHVADWSKDVPLFLLCMGRPDLLDLRPTWGGGKMNVTTVSLEPLSKEECERLIANLLGAADLPAVVAERITDAAEGNPLFVEEMLEMLIDDGRLERSNSSWASVGEMAEVAVPPSISLLLEARLDRLGPDERAVIERASVVGKVFYGGAIQALFGTDPPPNLRELVMGLVRRELIRGERSTLPGQEMYRFRHLLIRDAAYEGMPKELRAELHERFAAWLEDVAGERIDEQEEILGYHLEQAVELRRQLGPLGEREIEISRRAAHHLRDSGDRARDRGDQQAATHLYGRAIGLLPQDDAMYPDLLYELARAMSQTERRKESVEIFRRARDLARGRADLRTEWLSQLALSGALLSVDPHAVSTSRFREEIHEAIGIFESLGDEPAQARAWLQLAWTEWMPCRYAEALACQTQALENARRAEDRSTVDEVTEMTAGAMYFGPTPAEEALDRTTEMLSDALVSTHSKGVVMAFRGALRAMMGDLDQALEDYEAADRILRDFGPLGSATEYMLRGLTASMYGDPVRAEAAHRRHYEILDEAGDQGYLSTVAAALAASLAELGRLEEAEHFAQIGREAAAEDDVASQSLAEAAWAMVLSARGDLDGAIVAARRSISVAADSDMYFDLGKLHLNLSRILAKRGQAAEAVEEAREALSFFVRKGVVPAVARAKALLAELGAVPDLP